VSIATAQAGTVGVSVSAAPHLPRTACRRTPVQTTITVRYVPGLY